MIGPEFVQSTHGRAVLGDIYSLPVDVYVIDFFKFANQLLFVLFDGLLKFYGHSPFIRPMGGGVTIFFITGKFITSCGACAIYSFIQIGTIKRRTLKLFKLPCCEFERNPFTLVPFPFSECSVACVVYFPYHGNHHPLCI